MIDLAHDHPVEENGSEALSVTNPEGQGDLAAEDQDWGLESGPPPISPLEWYLMKLLEPLDGAPHEEVPQPPDEKQFDEATALQPLDTTDRRDATKTPKQGQPLWQTADEGSPQAPVTAGAERTPVRPTLAGVEEPLSPQKQEAPKSKQKSTIRSYPPREKTGGRQKMMAVLVPVLAIAMIVLLKHPLGARSTVKAAGAQASEAAARAVVTDVEIAWQIPSPYELGGRDPMRPVPPPVGAESQETAARPTETPVELTVTGILYSADRPAAIVDTQVVHEGQQVSGATVEKIDRDGVQFERNGRRWKQTINR
jgi:hypothetical protein